MNNTLTLTNGTTIEVANEDYSSEKIQNGERNKLITKDGWRLPSINELDLIFQRMHKIGNGNFRNDWYWSNDSFQVSWDYEVIMGYNFNDGSTNAEAFTFGSRSHGLSEAYVRLVRVLATN